MSSSFRFGIGLSLGQGFCQVIIQVLEKASCMICFHTISLGSLASAIFRRLNHPRLMFFKNFWHFRLLIPETSNHAVKHILAPQNSQPGPRDRILPSCKQLWIQNIRKNLLPNLHLLSCYLEGPYTESGSKKICLFLWEQFLVNPHLAQHIENETLSLAVAHEMELCVHSDCFAVKLGLEKNWTRHFA